MGLACRSIEQRLRVIVPLHYCFVNTPYARSDRYEPAVVRLACNLPRSDGLLDNPCVRCYYSRAATRLREWGKMGNNSSKTTSDDPDHHFAPPVSLPLGHTSHRHARWPRFTEADSPGPGEKDKLLPKQSPASTPTPAPAARQGTPRVTVVGVCSSGKSTLVAALKAAGYNARTVAQEHSYVPRLWQRSRPDLLIYLDASLHTIRQRGRTRWRQALLDTEHARLEHARQHCQLYIVTDGLSPEDVASRAILYLRTHADKETERPHEAEYHRS
jgi:hypothetical protein